jgi:hypothetical protein
MMPSFIDTFLSLFRRRHQVLTQVSYPRQRSHRDRTLAKHRRKIAHESRRRNRAA